MISPRLQKRTTTLERLCARLIMSKKVLCACEVEPSQQGKGDWGSVDDDRVRSNVNSQGEEKGKGDQEGRRNHLG